MPILNCFSQKKLEYNTIFEDEIFFSDSISSVMQKLGAPVNTKKFGYQTTLEYKRKLLDLISTVYYCFDNNQLCSVCYESDALNDDEAQRFLSEIQKIISKNTFDGVIHYTRSAKEYWELSDGATSMRVCLYAKNKIVYIIIDYFD